MAEAIWQGCYRSGRQHSMKESELYSLLLLLKSISFMVESHAPWGKPKAFPPGHSVFENQGHIYDVFEQVHATTVPWHALDPTFQLFVK